MIVYKMSRKLEKTHPCFRRFILDNNLWPYLSQNKNPELYGFSISSIQDDMRGYSISKWHRIVLKYLQKDFPSCNLRYDRSTSKQHLSFDEYDAIMFRLKWSS